MTTWSSYLEKQQDRFLDELKAFLRIPSISALPQHAADVERAAQWVAERLRQAGAEHVQVLPTGGHPVVYGDWLHAGPDAPTALIYGHFDVQPVDPLELWSAPPFEPTVRDGRIYARGASDDKGNMLAPILAFEALLATAGRLPVNVKFLFEGQEEIGSPQLPDFIAQHRDLLAADVAFSADGGQFSETEPLLLLGLRGLCGLEITVTGPNRDLHSGIYGGTVRNPIHALAQIIASFHTPEGRVAVEGFYDQVVELSPEEREALAQVPFDEEAFYQEIGVAEPFGEPGYTVLERRWIRPTLDANGIWGGFTQDGIKTVLPSQAHAKITCRLVPDQDPEAVLERLSDHIQRHLPAGVRVRVDALGGRARPYRIPLDHPGNRAAAAVLTELYGREPYHVRSGGTIPVTGILLDQVGLYTVSFGFALPDENIHSPDEFFRLDSFRRGQEAYARLFQELPRSL